MKKIIKELQEMYTEGIKKVLIVYNAKGELSIELEYQENYIDKELQLGIIDLEIYNSEEDLKDELEYLLN